MHGVMAIKFVGTMKCGVIVVGLGAIGTMAIITEDIEFAGVTRIKFYTLYALCLKKFVAVTRQRIFIFIVEII